MSSLKYIPSFSVKFFFQPIYTDYTQEYFNEDHMKIFSSNFERVPPNDYPYQVRLIWFRGFRGEDLNVKVLRHTDA
jgi:hypothetical protein